MGLNYKGMVDISEPTLDWKGLVVPELLEKCDLWRARDILSEDTSDWNKI